MLGDSNQTPKLHFIDVEILIGELSRWFDYSASTYLLFIIAFLLLLSLGLRYSAPFFYFILPPSLSIIPSTSFLAYNSVGSSQSNLLINQPNQNLMESFCKSPVVAAAHTFSNLEHNNQTVWQLQSPSTLCLWIVTRYQLIQRPTRPWSVGRANLFHCLLLFWIWNRQICITWD